MTINVKPDGLNFAPRVKEPESNLIAGMSAPMPQLMTPTPGPGPYALQEVPSWNYDFNPGTGSARATFNGEVNFTSGGSGSAGVTTWNGRSGAVVLTGADLVAVGAAGINSPIFTGDPTAPTPAPGDSDTSIATTAFVAQAVAAQTVVQTFNGRSGAVTLTAGDVTGAGGVTNPNAALTGTPTAPTAGQGSANSQIASTMFVSNAIASGTVTAWNGRQGPVTLTLSDVLSVGGAPIASPNFTGTPTGPTPTVGDASQKFATTAFVTNAISSATTGVASFNTRTGAVTLQLADVVGVGGAPLAGPAFTGTPTAPTPTGGDNSTKLATTAYVTSAITASASGVTTFNGRNGAVTLQLTDVTTVGGAPIASPTFTGSPLSTTPAPADNSTRLATTAYVVNALVPYALTSSLAVGSAAAPLMNGTAAAGSSAAWSHGDHVHPTDTTRYAASNPAGYQTAAQVSASLGAYVPLTGAVTITGSMNMQGITCTGLNVGGGAIVAGDISGTFIHASGNLQTSSAVVFGADLQNYISSDSGGTVMYVNGGNNYWSYTKATGYWQWVVNGAVTMQLQYTPGLLINGPAYKPGGGVWSDSSDARIKTIKGAYATGLDAISQLNPVNFTYKGNDTSEPPAQVDSSKSDEPVTVPYPNSMHRHAAESGTIYHGLIAQEVETVFPEMITKRDGYIDGVAVTDIRTIDATPLIYALVNAVKELAARVETLEAAL